MSQEVPISWKIINHQKEVNGPVAQSHSVIELTGTDGARQIVDAHETRVEHQTGYQTTALTVTTDYEVGSDKPTRSSKSTVIVSAVYGEMANGIRPDKVSVQIFDDGGYHAAKPITVKVPVPNPNAGLSFEDLVSKSLSNKLQ
jgi:hypothetical protein